MMEIAEGMLSSCRLEVVDFRKNCDCGIAELRLWSNIPLKVAELRLRKFFLQVAQLRLRTLKKVARARLCIWYICTEAVLRKLTKVLMKVRAQMNPDFWREIFGTQDWSLAHGQKSGFSAEAQPISMKIQKTWTSQENHISIWFSLVFCWEEKIVTQ